MSDLDQDFFHIFDTWFNCDVIDLYDSQEVESAARACAGELNRSHFDLENLIAQLTKVLETWDPQIIMKFINATNVDWFFDQKTEQILKEILSIIIDELKYYRNLQGRPS